MKAKAIINESHTILSEQKEILEKEFPSYEFLKVPKEGWSYEEMQEKVKEWSSDKDIIIFISPIGVMIKLLYETGFKNIKVFHNNRRRKDEVYENNGNTIVTTHVQKTGWMLV